MIKAFLFILSFFFFLTIVPLASIIYAQSAPPVLQSSNQITTPQPPGTLQLEIPRAYFVKGILWADLQFKNDTQSDLSGLMYGIQILSPSTRLNPKAGEEELNIVNPGWLVGYKDYPVFSIKQGESLAQKIEYQMGENFENGIYRILVQVKSRDGQILGYQTQTFPLVGNGKYLKLDPNSCTLQVGQTKYEMADGPIVDDSNPGTLLCEVTNPTTSPIRARLKVEYDRWSIALNTQTNKQTVPAGAVMTFAANEKKTISLKVPLPKDPQVYEGHLSLTDESSISLTPIVVFRWTISGPSATIIYVNADKTGYSAGAEAQISVLVTPSADLAWPNDKLKKDSGLENASLKVTISNGDEICGQSQTPLPKTSENKDWSEQKVAVKITKDCPNFTVKAEVVNNDILLAKSENDYGITQSELSPLEKLLPGTGGKNLLWIGLIVLLVIVSAGAFIFFRWKKRREGPPPPTPSASSGSIIPPATGSIAKAIIITLLVVSALKFIEWDRVMAAVFQPVDSPIANQTIKLGDAEASFWGNVSNFSSVTQTGRSNFTINEDCSVGNLYVYGYADHSYCSNFLPGIQPRILIDGQPANIISAQSPDSQVTTSTNCGARLESGAGCPPPNQFNLDSRNNGGGLRTGTASVNVPTSAQNGGQHTIEVQVGVGGRHLSNSGRSGYFIYSSLPGDYMKLTQTYTCGKCPAGQQNPHYVCNPDSKTCKQVDTCGVSTCTPGQNQCENCDNPNELKPHKACVNNTCTSVAACGAPSCNNTGDCCPAGMIYDAAADKCLPPACNVTCQNDQQCSLATDSCTKCLPNPNGTGTSCQPPYPVCGQSCNSDSQCTRAKDGCTACVPNATGTGSSCAKPPACGVGCSRDEQCAGAKDDCTSCAPNTAGQNVCQPKFNEAMCACDGFNALNLSNPSKGNFEFEAFAKVEKGDIRAAQVKDMKFTLYKSPRNNPDVGAPVASGTMVPQIVEATATKIRYRAVWSIAPPAYDPNAIYRVGADPTCIRKPFPASGSASLKFSSGSQLLSSDNSKVLGTDLNYSSSKLVQNNFLELGVLDDAYYTKIVQTDSCKFIKFEYGQY